MSILASRDSRPCCLFMTCPGFSTDCGCVRKPTRSGATLDQSEQRFLRPDWSIKCRFARIDFGTQFIIAPFLRLKFSESLQISVSLFPFPRNKPFFARDLAILGTAIIKTVTVARYSFVCTRVIKFDLHLCGV